MGGIRRAAPGGQIVQQVLGDLYVREEVVQ